MLGQEVERHHQNTWVVACRELDPLAKPGSVKVWWRFGFSVGIYRRRWDGRFREGGVGDEPQHT